MEYFLPIFNQMLVLFALIVIGFVLSRGKFLPDSATAVLSKLENIVLVPALVLGTFIENCTVSTLSQVWPLLVMSIVMAVIFAVISWVCTKCYYKEGYAQKVAAYCMTFSNFGFMGNAIFSSLFADIFFEYVLFTLPLWAMAYGWGVPTLLIPAEHKEKPTLYSRVKPFINPMLVCMLIGMVIGLTGLGAYMPNPIMQVIDSSAACMSPIAMILTGITLGQLDLLALIKRWTLYVGSIIKVLVYPLIMLGIIALLNLLPTSLFINDVFFKCALCVATMPTGLTSVFVPAAYGKDSSEAAGLALVSHVFSLGSIPLFFMLLQLIIA